MNKHRHVTKSKLALLTTQQADESERRGGEAKNMTLFRKPADQIDGRLTSRSNHLIGAWMPGSFIESERETQGGSKVERQNREGDVMGK